MLCVWDTVCSLPLQGEHGHTSPGMRVGTGSGSSTGLLSGMTGRLVSDTAQVDCGPGPDPAPALPPTLSGPSPDAQPCTKQVLTLGGLCTQHQDFGSIDLIPMLRSCGGTITAHGTASVTPDAPLNHHPPSVRVPSPL